MSDLKRIINQFRISGEVIKISAWGGGHINDTFKIQCNSGIDYILQKINTQIFTSPTALMDNLIAITKHVHRKKEYSDLVVKLITTKNGDFWVHDVLGFWRMYPFVEKKSSYDVTNSYEICEKTGRSYGAFLRALDDFPVNTLNITIPKFHNMCYRLEQFQQALTNQNEARLKAANSEIEYVQSKADFYSNWYALAVHTHQLRVTHNDTKLNNVLIGDAYFGTVIDLDTVMPGYAFFDVGDALRSLVISLKEDDPNVVEMELDHQKKDAFLKGYLDSAGDVLSAQEVDSFNQAGGYMAYIMAVRFITDFLNGNVYYKTKYPNHNLVRARNQLRVCELFLSY